jgi:hypothetical protein
MTCSCWLGRWDCMWGKDGRGSSEVRAIMDGRVILERFDGRPGLDFQGMSVSVYRPASRSWRQTWVDDEGNYWDFAGGMDGDRMILRTKELQDGNEVELRMVFFDIERDSFEWSWHRSGGKSRGAARSYSYLKRG